MEDKIKKLEQELEKANATIAFLTGQLDAQQSLVQKAQQSENYYRNQLNLAMEKIEQLEDI